MSDELPFFAPRLRELLDKRGMTAYAAAKRAGLSKQTLSALLSGKQGATWDTVQRLCLVLGVDCRAFADPALELPGARARARAAAEGGGRAGEEGRAEEGAEAQ